MKNNNIIWFRKDLRLTDNPALEEASNNANIIPIYILDDSYNSIEIGEASKVWLYYSLKKLNHTLSNKLLFYKGVPLKILDEIIQNNKIHGLYWNRCYEPLEIKRDGEIKNKFNKIIKVKSFNGSLIKEPWETLKEDNTPYKVFTPLYKKAYLNLDLSHKVYNKPKNIYFGNIDKIASKQIDSLNLLPKLSWGKDIIKGWKVGEKEAIEKFNKFLKKGINNYKEGRNFPHIKSVSFLSPHLHYGEISPKYIWKKIKSISQNKNTEHFLSEICWREFSYYLLYYFPDLQNKNLQNKFDNFPWSFNEEFYLKWKKGLTGYPIVDAGMRELYSTGYMHNRVRMIVASFLVKNLLIHWNKGEKWFWNCLFDADLASNSASWQWVAGSGSDAAPYFRIFNPITQGKKFDSKGLYTKKYVSELKDLPNEYLFDPWNTPNEILLKANIVLGKDYPKPIVDIKESREKALLAYKKIK